MAKGKPHYSETQVRKLIAKAEQGMVEYLSNGIFGIFALALHDTKGFGAEDIREVKEVFDRYVIGLDSGEIKANDVREVLKEELNISFKWR